MSEIKDEWSAIQSLQEQVSALNDNQKNILKMIRILQSNTSILIKEATKEAQDGTV